MIFFWIFLWIVVYFIVGTIVWVVGTIIEKIWEKPDILRFRDLKQTLKQNDIVIFVWPIVVVFFAVTAIPIFIYERYGDKIGDMVIYKNKNKIDVKNS